jgi:hypothetical protein
VQIVHSVVLVVDGVDFDSPHGTVLQGTRLKAEYGKVHHLVGMVNGEAKGPLRPRREVRAEFVINDIRLDHGVRVNDTDKGVRLIPHCFPNIHVGQIFGRY